MNNSYNEFPISIEAYHTNTPKHSDGCLLINQKQIFKDKAQTIQIDTILQAGKKRHTSKTDTENCGMPKMIVIKAKNIQQAYNLLLLHKRYDKELLPNNLPTTNYTYTHRRCA